MCAALCLAKMTEDEEFEGIYITLT